MPRPSFLRRILDFPIEDWLGVAALFATLVVMSTQIFLRYVLNDSLIWSEELSRYLLIAIAFLGCATGVRKRCHIRIDVIDMILSEPVRRALSVAIDLLVLFYLAYVVYASIEILGIFKRQPSTAMGVSMSVPYSVITIGFGLAALRMVLHYAPGKRG
jgi:TRAP-type C4-dicarboxylate transport system permease small subunit